MTFSRIHVSHRSLSVVALRVALLLSPASARQVLDLHVGWRSNFR